MVASSLLFLLAPLPLTGGSQLPCQWGHPPGPVDEPTSWGTAASSPQLWEGPSWTWLRQLGQKPRTRSCCHRTKAPDPGPPG